MTLEENLKRRAARVAEFKQRTFTGAEVLEITAWLRHDEQITILAADRTKALRDRQPTEADYDDPPMP